MSEQENAGQGESQNSQAEESTSQNDNNEPYKVFETKEDYSQAQDKFFRGAYNEGLGKMQKDVKSHFGIDGEFESNEELFSAIESKYKTNGSGESGEEDPEREELQSKIKEWKQKAEQNQNALEQYKRDQTINSSINSALSQIKQDNKVTLKDEHLERLFKSDYNVKLDDDGQPFVERSNGTPVLDGEGNRKAVADVLSSYVKENNYAQPKAQGVGGGTGGGSVSEKPKFSEFEKLMNSNKQDDKKRGFEMREKAKEVGWADGDSPQDKMKWKKKW